MNSLPFIICISAILSFSAKPMDKKDIKAITEYYYSMDENPGKLKKTVSYRYTENGKVLEETEKNTLDELTGRTAFCYDTRNRLIEKKTCTSNGETIYRSLFLYDASGNKFEGMNYSGICELISKTINFLNDSGKVIRYETYNSDGKIYNIHSFKYTTNNQEREEVISYPDGTIEWKSESIYNEEGKLINRNEYPSCCLRISYFYRYDDQGNLIEEKSARADGTQGMEYGYQFQDVDKNGNWLAKIISENGKPTTMIKRIIEYFIP